VFLIANDNLFTHTHIYEHDDTYYHTHFLDNIYSVYFLFIFYTPTTTYLHIMQHLLNCLISFIYNYIYIYINFQSSFLYLISKQIKNSI
jgi:hypothetical protein